MASVVESLNLISKTMEEILDFVANDETLSEDFKQYLEINGIEIETERDFNNVIIQYMLDMKMQNGLRVLEYFRRNNPSQEEIINALKESIVSVFKVNKILSNAYVASCLTSDIEMTIIPMVKMNHLKQIGKFDYIHARIIELDNVQYILEIYDVISEFDVYKATIEAIKCMLQNPKIAHYKNPEKEKELEKSAIEFYEKFQECFKSEFIVTTNKKVDSLIEFFNNYRLDGNLSDYSSLIEKAPKNEYLKIEELNCSDNTFMQTAVGGFSSHKETYDVALWVDKKRGLYIIPFFETFTKCFKEEIEGKTDCIKEFLTSDKIPPSAIRYVQEKNENFFETINKTLGTDFSNLEEILFNTKAAYLDDGVYSPVTVLFNSDLFSTILNIEKTKESTPQTKTQEIGRNEPCPCGSGLKYKKCCGKN